MKDDVFVQVLFENLMNVPRLGGDSYEQKENYSRNYDELF